MQLTESALPAKGESSELADSLEVELTNVLSQESTAGAVVHRSQLTPHIEAAAAMKHSFESTASTNNTDICVLDTQESHYGCVESLQCQDTIDFTVVEAHDDGRPCCHFDESTEILLQSDYNVKASRAFSGTDSDVEVLMSEEIVDSDWSAGGAAIDEFEDVAQVSNAHSNQQIQSVTNASETSSSSVKKQDSTDLDISVEEFNHWSISSFDHFNRGQLINTIRDQAARIRYLEGALKRTRMVQQAFFTHVETLKQELGQSECASMELKSSHQTIN